MLKTTIAGATSFVAGSALTLALTWSGAEDLKTVEQTAQSFQEKTIQVINKYKSLQTAAIHLETELNNKESLNNQLKSDLNNVNAQLTKLKNENETFQANKTDAAIQIDDLKRQLETANSTILELENRKKELEDENNPLRAELDQAKALITELQEKAKNTSKENIQSETPKANAEIPQVSKDYRAKHRNHKQA
ncbi:hypothetical protein [Bacillus testis]|uniref:hypothetical protein n=1 Tax=Bacillus testis TaxID=1622072 RepID=UPI00067EA103|nr:hypothetical protein [Bacillus testis]